MSEAIYKAARAERDMAAVEKNILRLGAKAAAKDAKKVRGLHRDVKLAGGYRKVAQSTWNRDLTPVGRAAVVGGAAGVPALGGVGYAAGRKS